VRLPEVMLSWIILQSGTTIAERCCVCQNSFMSLFLIYVLANVMALLLWPDWPVCDSSVAALACAPACLRAPAPVWMSCRHVFYSFVAWTQPCSVLPRFLGLDFVLV
jgi:hypothetical protein